MKKSLAVGAVAAAIALVVSACGGSDSDPADGEGDSDVREVEVFARDLRFEPDEIRITAGETVRLVLVNEDQGTDHDLSAEGLVVRRIEGGGHGEGHDDNADELVVHASSEESSEIVFVADAPGTYDIYCTVDGHRDAGMVGRIIVV